jgi:cytochrome d ubiquinol oxidase subunit I
MEFDALILSRIQFGFTIAFHIVFPAFTIGLASYLGFLEYKWLRTKIDDYRRLYMFWVKIFAVSFGMGVVSGIVMSYQVGTNWSVFADRTGNVLGPLFSYEVVTAFFLEASFLGIMLFGWNKVGPKLHFVATVAVAVGTLISAFWILSANSWMHTPAGFALEDGTFYAENWWEIVFNPSFPYRFAHMVGAAYLTTAFMVAGAGALYLLQGRGTTEGQANRNAPMYRRLYSSAMWFILIAAPVQIALGDLHGLNTLEHQPVKVAAMEGHWEEEIQGAPLILFAIPDAEAETNRYEIAIPKASSFILKHDWDATLRGLKAWPEEERPPMEIVFFSFRIMVAIGFLMLFVALAGLALRWRGKLLTTRWLHWASVVMAPSGFVAVLAGWVTTEVGRQPYVVYGLMRTSDAVAPVTTGTVASSLIAFVVVYAVVFGFGSWYLLHLVLKGPESAPVPKSGGGVETGREGRHPKRPLSAVENPAE